MFGTFIHPKPIVSRRPVAQMSVPGTHRAAVATGHVLTVNGSARQRPAVDVDVDVVPVREKA